MAMNDTQFYGGSTEEANNSRQDWINGLRFPMNINGKLYLSFADYEQGKVYLQETEK